MKRNEQVLTKAEFQLMSFIWDRNKAMSAWDIMACYNDPKPAYATVATQLKILTEKGYLTYHKEKGQGKTHHFTPLVTRAEYTRRTMQDVKKNFFGGSLKSMFSYFIQEDDLSDEEINEILDLIKK